MDTYLSLGSKLEYKPSMRLSRQSQYDWLDSISSFVSSLSDALYS